MIDGTGPEGALPVAGEPIVGPEVPLEVGATGTPAWGPASGDPGGGTIASTNCDSVTGGANELFGPWPLDGAPLAGPPTGPLSDGGTLQPDIVACWLIGGALLSGIARFIAAAVAVLIAACAATSSAFAITTALS